LLPNRPSIMSFGLGVAAALAAPLIMTLGFIVWDTHWKGSAFALNLFKCNLASLGFLILVCTTRSNPFPKEVFTGEAVGFMFISSTIGIVIGDWTWLEALQLLGARRVILMDSLKPFLAALMGWLFLDEKLRPATAGGIALTVAGVLLVSLETEQEKDSDTTKPTDASATATATDGSAVLVTTGDPPAVIDPIVEVAEEEGIQDQVGTESKVSAEMPRRDLRRGYPYSILNVALDTYGAVLIKQHGEDFTVWEINLLRFGFAGVVMLLISFFMMLLRCLRPTTEACTHPNRNYTPWYSLPSSTMTRSSWLHVSFGVVLVTFATPSLSNYALFEIALALALTLGSIGPIYSLPLTYLLQQDPPTVRTIAGAFLAVGGVVILTLKGTLPDR
jgi:drug/metabolite transporter (DMT)-like permease